MLTDKDLQLSAEQVVTESAASTNHIDIAAATKFLGKKPGIVVQVKEAADSSGDAATVTFSIQTDDNDSFSSPETVWSSAAIPQASLTLNSQPVAVELPVALQRYVRVYYTVGTENLTKGKFDAKFVADFPVR